MIYTHPQVDHLKTLEALRERLTILNGSPQPELRTEEITNVRRVIAIYERLYEGPDAQG